MTPVSPFATSPQTLGLPAEALGAMPPDTLTADAFRVADLSTADGIIVLLVAHQRVHAQNGWREQVQGDRGRLPVPLRPHSESVVVLKPDLFHSSNEVPTLPRSRVPFHELLKVVVCKTLRQG